MDLHSEARSIPTTTPTPTASTTTMEPPLPPPPFLSSSSQLREESRCLPLPPHHHHHPSPSSSSPLPSPLTTPAPSIPPAPVPQAGESASPRSPQQQEWSQSSGPQPQPSHPPPPPQQSQPATAAPVVSTHQNRVSHVMLHGILIVSLNIDSKERLCLAQISNTLLKDYSYNEIHNRRVALGITCVQCTPVQLEILRRAGAMPVSSRRCGMITKREAERLVKSFLEDSEPPKLPEDFAFQVFHECGWGCHGYFEPARYNSSRAKCIKCGYCSVYFSPNKFIFHFHRVPEAKYHHPDAANFNSWRRHLKLASGPDNDDEMHVWEDVKAMFNGGTRKRIFSSSPRTSKGLYSSNSSSRTESSSTNSEVKKKVPKLSGHPNDLQVTPKPPFPTHTFSPYSWGYTPAAKPSYPFVSVNTSQSLCFGFPPPGAAKDNGVPGTDNGLMKGGMAPLQAPSWLGRSAMPFSNLDAFWDKAFGLPRPMGGVGPGFRGGMYPPPSLPKSPSGGGGGGGGTGGSHIGENGMEDCRPEEAGGERRREPSSLDLTRGPHPSHPGGNNGPLHSDRLSAFRPVGRTGTNTHAPEDDQASAESDVDADETEEIDVTEEDCLSPQDLSQPELREPQSTEEIGKETGGEGEEEGERGVAEEQRCAVAAVEESDGEELPENPPRPCQDDVVPEPEHDVIDYSSNENKTPQETEEYREEEEAQEDDRQASGADDSGLSDESEADGENEDTSILSMTKEELCHSLKREVCNRKKKEKEVSVLRDTFQEEVTREKAFRDQMARQLEVLRETLTNELEQERKVRFSLQQKLKEAHDALHSISCSMLSAGRDACGFKDTVLPR
ncbi:hypothetical protein ACOMHN_018757 [Nucella lapillus]